MLNLREKKMQDKKIIQDKRQGVSWVLVLHQQERKLPE